MEVKGQDLVLVTLLLTTGRRTTSFYKLARKMECGRVKRETGLIFV